MSKRGNSLLLFGTVAVLAIFTFVLLMRDGGVTGLGASPLHRKDTAVPHLESPHRTPDFFTHCINVNNGAQVDADCDALPQGLTLAHGWVCNPPCEEEHCPGIDQPCQFSNACPTGCSQGLQCVPNGCSFGACCL